jgi:hypothetical protein
MERKGVSSISGSRSIAELAEFWDTHDAADFDSETYEVQLKFDIQSRHHYVAVDPELLARIRKFAQARGLSTESLVNLWLQERVLLSSPG